MHGFEPLNHEVHHRRYQGREQNLKGSEVIQVGGTPASGIRVSNPDPELLHQYDNFYQTTKSLLVLFQIMGVMPIERDIGKTTYRYNIIIFKVEKIV